MNLLSGLRTGDSGFDTYDEFVPARLPEPGPFLDGQAVLTGRAHVAVHRLARSLFEDRGVYDVTFGYNLARLNLDHRHPDAGFRYAVERDADDVEASVPDDARVLRAEFTPTTAFCPQSDALSVGAFRAWNGCRDRHEFDLVRVRVSPRVDDAAEINGRLDRLESVTVETGTVPGAEADPVTVTDTGPSQ